MGHATSIQESTLILVRHGKVANPNHVVYSDLAGFDLDPEGVRQADAVGRHLAPMCVDSVISSPLERAVSTATAIARWHRLEVAVDARATEWRLSSRWVGQRWTDLPNLVPGELEAYLARPDDLPFADETLHDVATRMTDLVASVTGTTGRCTVIVSHQDAVAATVLALTGEPQSRLLDASPPHASATTLRHGNAGWVVVGRWSPNLM